MKFGAYLGLALFSTVKFMFAPLGGPGLKLSFLETYLSCTAGALVCAVIFYFGANYFMKRAYRKRVEKYRRALDEGKTPKRRKNFTLVNKVIVRAKRSIGLFGSSMWIPFFFSMPIGCIIVAKFYGKKKITFPIILLGIFFNAFLTTSIAYWIL